MPQNTSDLYLELCLVQQHKRLGFSTNDWPFYTITKFVYDKDILLALTTDFDLRIHTFGTHKYLPHSGVSNIFVIGRTI